MNVTHVATYTGHKCRFRPRYMMARRNKSKRTAVSPEIQNAAAASKRVARTDRKPAGDGISAK